MSTLDRLRDEWLAHLANRLRTDKTLRDKQRVWGVAYKGIRTWEELCAPGGALLVEGNLARHANAHEFAKRTYNRWLTITKQFAGWVAMHRREGHPLAILRPHDRLDDDRRVQRRALTEDEASWLILATSGYYRPSSMGAVARAMMYRLMLGSGLRTSEARSLLVSDIIRRDDGRVMLKLPGLTTKNSKDALIPLANGFGTDLRNWLTDRDYGGLVFPRLPAKPARVFRGDLEHANIDRLDERGRIVDLHALRYTYITQLVHAGVDPKTVQQLARHSTIQLTMDVYAQVVDGAGEQAVDKLPSL
jgi:integrase